MATSSEYLPGWFMVSESDKTPDMHRRTNGLHVTLDKRSSTQAA